MGSLAEELNAGVEAGWVRRSELGEYMRVRGFQDSSTTRALGSAVKKWGSLSRIEVSSGETCYIPREDAYDALDDAFGRPASNRFAFRSRSLFHGMSRRTDHPIPIQVDVIANESSANCKAKVRAIPFGDREVQVYWRPHDALSLDMNQGETTGVELVQLFNPVQREIANYENALKNETNTGTIEHIEMRLRQIYERAAGQQPLCSIRTPDAEGGAIGLDGPIAIFVLVLVVYSAGGLSWFPFLILRKKLEESEILPIVKYESKRVQWSGEGLYRSR
ncbi:MAG: hypothetical protein JRN16_03795 [Nitrososphaerota archaeon]|nr:hypothetical protein [Nitrososphaerota archaeon]